jgi:hypothetical protein
VATMTKQPLGGLIGPAARRLRDRQHGRGLRGACQWPHRAAPLLQSAYCIKQGCAPNQHATIVF